MPPSTIQLPKTHPEKSSPFCTNPTLSNNHRIESLQELVQLEQQREHLQIQLDTVLKKINSLQLALFATSSDPLSQLPGSLPPSLPQLIPSSEPPPHRLSHSGRPIRMPRGELRHLMLQALQSAGPEGIEVRPLAVQLGINPVNIHSWFHSALRKLPQIRKLAPGRYVLEGQLHPPAPASKTLPKKSRTQTPLARRTRRGEMTRQIVQLLQASGERGISVPEIAARIGSHYRNVHVWLCSTGRKGFAIERVTRGVYRLRSETLQPALSLP